MAHAIAGEKLRKTPFASLPRNPCKGRTQFLPFKGFSGGGIPVSAGHFVHAKRLSEEFTHAPVLGVRKHPRSAFELSGKRDGHRRGHGNRPL